MRLGLALIAGSMMKQDVRFCPNMVYIPAANATWYSSEHWQMGITQSVYWIYSRGAAHP
jgi:hypothetical protein